MSMEDAIKEHAAALREIAAAIRSLGHCAMLPGQIEAKASAYEVKAGQVAEHELKTFAVDEIAKSEVRGTSHEEAAADDISGEKSRDAEVKPDAELDAAVQKVEQDSKLLDYKADVFPVLIQVSKKDKATLAGMLKKYGAKTGQELKAEYYAAIVADANAYLAS